MTAPPQPARPPTHDSIEPARYPPGTMLAGRYRIVDLIGRGGMGEVYRADDLKLGQTVALKFLPADVAHDPGRLARFHNEVRLARQVSHPNVCRVYDIGEVDGDHFLTMEYVDGEDLASLLRQIGRLPPDKAIQVARQLCAGLAAAHDHGVLHRDLKPANVLLDGRGRVRIVDFGLAAIAGDPTDARLRAGTPAYMAPEQLDGRGASIRSDIYAVGLLLYEIWTGKPAQDAVSARAMAGGKSPSRPPTPSSLQSDIDPAVERVILRCLEPDPAERPASAMAVAAALPGGDPLAAALAAGETPSPEMVAAAGAQGAVSPLVGVACLVAIASGLLAVVWLSQRTTITSFVTMTKAPEALAERARTIIADLGLEFGAADSAYGFELNERVIRSIEELDRSAARWSLLQSSEIAPIEFWYRQSPQHLDTPWAFFAASRVTRNDPPETLTGMVSLVLDPDGQLRGLRAVPIGGPTEGHEETSDDPIWRALFAHASLPFDRFTRVEPARLPPFFADVRAAWDGPDSGRPNSISHVEAAMAGGKLVYFETSTAPSKTPQTQPDSGPSAGGNVIQMVLYLFMLTGAVALARRNLRVGRADRRGGFVLASFIIVMETLAGLLAIHDPLDLLPQRGIITTLGAAALFPYTLYYALIVWVSYVGIEPYVRRIWPDVLIGWSRLLAGRLRDPLVGRDVLVGVVGGVLTACLSHLQWLAPTWVDAAPPVPLGVVQGLTRLRVTTLVLGGRYVIAQVASTLGNGATLAIGSMLIIVLVTLLVGGRRRAALALLSILLTVSAFLGNTSGPFATGSPLLGLLSTGMVLFIGVRFGLLPFTIVVSSRFLLTTVTLDLSGSHPYVFASYAILGWIALLSLYGFRIATAGRPLLGAGLADDAVRG